MIYYNYINLFIYFLTALFFSFILVFLSFCLDNLLFFKARKDFEKISSYECGFQPFSDARGTVDVKFYLVAILFIIFDLEITFLIPWILNLTVLNNNTFFIMIIFLFILTLGFIYEWLKGALDL